MRRLDKFDHSTFPIARLPGLATLNSDSIASQPITDAYALGKLNGTQALRDLCVETDDSRNPLSLPMGLFELELRFCTTRIAAERHGLLNTGQMYERAQDYLPKKVIPFASSFLKRLDPEGYLEVIPTPRQLRLMKTYDTNTKQIEHSMDQKSCHIEAGEIVGPGGKPILLSARAESRPVLITEKDYLEFRPAFSAANAVKNRHPKTISIAPGNIFTITTDDILEAGKGKNYCNFREAPLPFVFFEIEATSLGMAQEVLTTKHALWDLFGESILIRPGIKKEFKELVSMQNIGAEGLSEYSIHKIMKCLNKPKNLLNFYFNQNNLPLAS